MKKNNLVDIRKKTVESLEKLVTKKRLELIKEKTKIDAGKSKNIKKLRNSKKEVAQILTIIREKKLVKKENKKATVDDKD